jgi:hypothetical protein
MNIFEHDWRFWAAVVGAAFVRVATSENHSLVRSALTVGMAVFAAWTFTDVTLHYLNLPPATYRNPVAALLALTGKGLMRFAIDTTNDPNKALDLWDKWRGK